MVEKLIECRSESPSRFWNILLNDTFNSFKLQIFYLIILEKGVSTFEIHNSFILKHYWVISNLKLNIFKVFFKKIHLRSCSEVRYKLWNCC